MGAGIELSRDHAEVGAVQAVAALGGNDDELRSVLRRREFPACRIFHDTTCGGMNRPYRDTDGQREMDRDDVGRPEGGPAPVRLLNIEIDELHQVDDVGRRARC